MNSTYLDRWIIGLTAATLLCDAGEGATPCSASSGSALFAKTTLQYDESGSTVYQAAATQQDNTNYGSGLLAGRANLSSTRRYDVSNLSQYVSSSMVYNTAGSLIAATDGASHESTISYTDAFSANGIDATTISYTALAYPTTLTDAAGNSSTIKYHYDLGAKTRTQTPTPAGQSQGLIQKFAYDTAGRLDRVTTVNNSAYTRYEYGPTYVLSYVTVNNVADEAMTCQNFDGAGRVFAVAHNHPGSSGTYSMVKSVYDKLGRVVQQSNPTEINAYWTPTGDDSAGFLYTQQTYDWKGRPLVTTNPDTTTKTASYDGCGCAGGEVETSTDEGTIDPIDHTTVRRRQQKIYHDVLGRPWKTEVLNWESGAPYATTVNFFNARDQITKINQYQGAATSDLSCPTNDSISGSDTTWKQTTALTSGWQNLSFDDSSWSPAVDEGAYGGGPWGSTPALAAGTPAHWIWYYDSRSSSDSATVYFRKTFTAHTTSATLTIRADDNSAVYLNGSQVATTSNWQQVQSATLTLTPGNSYVLAVQATNTGGPGGFVADLNSGGATCQQTTMHYDGHGRMDSKHLPEQDANKATTYNYNLDDTVASVVDGRNANSAYSYNGRHQVTSVAHTLTGANTIATSYAYDAAGNRTSMSHTIDAGSGPVAKDSATFVYNQLSQMTSETRHIQALAGNSMAGNYSMNYGYTLSGELQSVTDPFNSTTSFTYDTAGRTASVTGSFGGVNYTYASNVAYRAWGAVKAASFGDSTSETVTYNSRLQPTQFRSLWSGYNAHRYNYSYFDDGRLQRLTDLDDLVGQPSQVTFHYMSRVYAYDQAARTASVGPVPNSNVPAPFTGTYGYDAFANMNSRSGQYALNANQSDNSSYTNNRRSGWSYDADGRLTGSSDSSTSSSLTWNYDAAGEQVSVAETIGSTTTTNSTAYDGDGEMIFESVNNPGLVRSDYLIHSTVLSSVLSRLDDSGNQSITYVPSNGLVMPLQQRDSQGNLSMSWVHRDASGLQEDGKAFDPLGNLIPNAQPQSSGPPPNMPFYGATYGGATWSAFTNANNLSTGCTLDGVRASCNSVLGAIASEWVDPTKTRFLAPGLGDFVNMGINTYATAAGSLIDPSSHKKPQHPDDPDDDIIRTRTDEEYVPYWQWGFGFIGQFALAIAPQNQGPLPPPKPTPGPDPTGPHFDICRSQTWDWMMARYNSALGSYGMDMSVDNGGHLSNPKNLSVTNIVGILEGHGAFERFSDNINPLHWGGVHLQGTLQSVWFHLILYPAKTTEEATKNTTRKVDDWSKPPIGVEMHCERGGLRPSSLKHGWEYLREMLLESWFTSP